MEQTKIEQAEEIIGQALSEIQLEDSEVELTNKFMELAMDSYILVVWPESQDYMEKDWFEEEAILDNSENAIPSSYLIPISRLIN